MITPLKFATIQRRRNKVHFLQAVLHCPHGVHYGYTYKDTESLQLPP